MRVALGAQPRDVLAMMAANAVRLGAIGIGIGLAVAYGAGRSMEALLAGVKPDDLQVFARRFAAAYTLVPRSGLDVAEGHTQ